MVNIMQIKFRILIEHKIHKNYYLNRMSDGLTHDLDAAMPFRDIGEASEFLLNNQYAPQDKEFYTYAKMKITKEIMEDESNDPTT